MNHVLSTGQSNSVAHEGRPVLSTTQPYSNLMFDVTGPDTVAIELAAPPSGKTRLRYAFTGTPLTCPGKTVGPRGNLRDSDATPSQGGYELFNWGLRFEVPVE